MSGGDQGWQVGDLALCVEPSWICQGQVMAGPAPGSVHRVTAAAFFTELQLFGMYGYFSKSGIWLGFAEFGSCGFHSCCFKKIDPHTRDAEDDETIALLNGKPAELAPVRTPEPVS